ncbi:MAG: cyclic nucleotide-binding domain-containing protein [Gammaproteobacteria bacterium]|nr:MAG: cyclic nucleotide-binding domain-containing protein [Gammaproteobacteria bacterium]
MPSSRKNKLKEVSCDHCSLKDLCEVLGYGSDETNLPEGTLKKDQGIAKGETIFRMGDSFRSLFAVRAGSFKTLVSSDTDSEKVLSFHLAGELVGAEGLAQKHHSCTARALEPSSVCEINLERLEETGLPMETLHMAIISLLGKKIAFEHSINASLIRQSAETRLAAFIYCLSERLTAHGMPGLEFKLNISRADIANYLGLAMETVSRILKKFEKEGMLSVSGKHFNLKDMERLKYQAESI